ncbi:MAG: Isopentenyl-diphosphate Delta-isomerase [Parcubacteria group bacterium GW2011_GWC1_38_6]|nr:MAG: Isopentenyl-diphosphate Delta-isomerase [Parcubacteria group bacterium GW2011_GWC1_38_6]
MTKDYKPQVVLVNKGNRKIGIEEKLKAHKKGKLHRAFSVFVFNPKGELLIQQRAKTKYHSGGLWSNTACSHPQPRETCNQAAHKALIKEMGFDCKLKKAFNFIYRVDLQNGLTEYEYDCVFFGEFDGEPKPSHKEVMGYKWVSLRELRRDITKKPKKYSAWFKIALEKIITNQ